MLDSTRKTVSSVLNKTTVLRQSISDVRAWAQKQPPMPVPSAETMYVADSVKTGILEMAANRKKEVMTQKDVENLPFSQLAAEDGPLVVVRPYIPVCGIMNNGIPLHPPGKNQSKGNVSANRHFGSSFLYEDHFRAFMPFVDPETFKEVIKVMPIYSTGTQVGFYKRLKQQMGRECRKPEEAGIPRSTFKKWMKEMLPYRPNLLVDWNLDPIDLLDSIKTSMVASAGAPYWRPKSEAIPEAVECVIPMILEAFKNEDLVTLQKSQPELFLTEVKNKADRYENPYEKTRPYTNIPFHWGGLFSILSQSFTGSLATVADSANSANAYGLSWANGGAMKLYERVKKLPEGDICFYAYGDDVDVWFKQEGEYYRICPDFKQMDGSVDSQTIQWTIDYIVDVHRQRYGEDRLNFWQSVAKVWYYMATNPEFIIDGQTVYRKKSDDGLMTGVVGTTLFDTVKSIIAYRAFIEWLSNKPNKFAILRDQDRVANYFQEIHGLIIKPGTWTVEKAQMEPIPGKLLTNQKFLGVRLKWYQHGENVILAPYNEYKDWLTYALVPRKESVDVTRKDGSYITKGRYLFDMLRGQLITGGALDERFYEAANAVAKAMDPAIPAMDVQAGDGKGEFMGTPFLPDFSYPSSIFWPTREWVLDLYALEDHKLGVEQMNFFPYQEWVEFITPVRKRTVKQQATVDVVTPLNEIAASVVVSAPPPKPVLTDYSPPSLLLDKVVNLDHEVKYNLRSHIINVTPSGVEEKPKLPTQAELVLDQLKPFMVDLTKQVEAIGSKWEHFYRLRMDKPLEFYNEVAKFTLENKDEIWAQIVTILVYDHPFELPDGLLGALKVRPMYPLKLLAQRLHLEETRVEKIARDHGYLVLGHDQGWKYICSAPLHAAQDTIRSQEISQIKENQDLLREKGTEVSVQKKTLRDNVERQVLGPPAQKPKPKRVLENLPKFRKIPDFHPERGPFRQMVWQGNTILEYIGMQVDIAFKEIGQTPRGLILYEMTVYNEQEQVVYGATGLKGNMVYEFWMAICRKYLDDVAEEEAEDWVDEFTKKEELTQGPRALKVGPPLAPSVGGGTGFLQPLLIEDRPFCYRYKKGKDVYLLLGTAGASYSFSQHLDGTLSGPTTLNNVQTFSARLKTTANVVASLAKALGKPMSVGNLLTPTHIAEYYPYDVSLLKELKETLNLDYEFPSNVNRKTKTKEEAGEAEGRNTSPVVHLKSLRKEEKEQEREEKENSNENERYKSGNFAGRERFYKRRPFQDHGQNRPINRRDQFKSNGVDRNPRRSRSRPMAKMEAKTSYFRSNDLRN